jgi:hypothetical protein
VRTSSFDHARRTTFFFLANFRFLVSGVGLVPRRIQFGMWCRSSAKQLFERNWLTKTDLFWSVQQPVCYEAHRSDVRSPSHLLSTLPSHVTPMTFLF